MSQGQGFQGYTRDQVAVQTKVSPQDVDAIAAHLGFKKATYLEPEVKRIAEFKAWMQKNNLSSVAKAIEFANSAQGAAPKAKAGSVPPQQDGPQGRSVSAPVKTLAEKVAPNIDNEAKELRVLTEVMLLDRYGAYMNVPGEDLNDPRLEERYQRLESATTTVVNVEATEVEGTSPLEALAGLTLPALPSAPVLCLSGTTSQRSQPQTALPAAT